MATFSDDLLADLKQDLARDAEAERARLAAEQAARAAAEADAARRAEEARRAEMQARLEAEDRRRALAHEAVRARIEGPPAAAQTPARVAAAPAVTLPTPPVERHGAGFYFVVMGLPMICLTAIAVAWLLKAPDAVPVAPVAPPVQLTIDTRPVTAEVPEVAEPGPAEDAPTQPVVAPIAAEQPRATTPVRTPSARRPARPATEAKPDKPGRLFGGTSMNDIMGAD